MLNNQLKGMSSPRKRDTLLTVWLTLLLVANIAGTLLYVFLAIFPAGFGPFLPVLATWVIYLFAAIGALNAACVCLLFLWKKMGLLRTVRYCTGNLRGKLIRWGRRPRGLGISWCCDYVSGASSAMEPI